MKIQSLSVVVPGRCPNNCFFCVSQLHPSQFINQIEGNERFHDLYRDDFIKRMAFARDNGCNTIMLTGDGEPQLNKTFLNSFSEWNQKLTAPFRWIEMQTAGTLIDEVKLRWLRNTIGVNVISLSLSDVFSSDENQIMNGMKHRVDISGLCSEIKRYDFGLRLSLNLTKAYNNRSVSEIFERCRELGADQVTLRVLYTSEGEHKINKAIRENRVSLHKIQEFRDYVIENGRKLERLPFGAWRYSVLGMSIVLDEDCMSEDGGEAVKYLVLQPNCKLYTKWDDKGSLLF